jgi:hypothetical protein
MYKRILFSGLLLSSAAMAQEVAITGKDFLSGAGDAKLADIGRQAAAAGKVVVITAPKYWLNQAAGKVHGGAANAHVTTSEGFFENVVVRIEDPKPVKPVEAPKPVEPPKPIEAPKPAPRPVPKAPPVVEQAPAPLTLPTPEPVKAAPAPAAVVAAPTPPPAPAASRTPAKPAVDPSIAIKQKLEKNLNEGRSADGDMQVSQLEKDDQLFVDGDVRAVVRRLGLHTQMYWLQGDLNLDRAELVPNGTNRYKIAQPISNIANPTLRTTHGGTQRFVGTVPDAKAPVRESLQRQYADGKDVDATMVVSDLRKGDIVYTGNGAAIVVRRSSLGYERSWLTGEVDLHQTGIQQQGNAYHVLTDTLK